MSNNFSYSIVGNTICCIINGTVYSINTNRPEAKRVSEIINSPDPDVQELQEVFERATALTNYCEGKVRVVGSQVLYGDMPVDNAVTDKILHFMDNDLPYRPLLKFLERLLQNPSHNSVQQLYLFMEHEKLQITAEGMLIAYKGVDDNLLDVYTHSIDNSPGCVNEMARNNVEDDPRKGCAKGYHVGTYEYAKNWGPRVMRVLVDPADVVSVPDDHSFEKCRTAKYRVLEEIDPSDMVDVSAYNSDW